MSNLELEGARTRLRGRRMELAVAINAKIKGVKGLLATSAIDPIEKIDIAGAARLAIEARDEKQEYLEILDKLRAIDEELD
jgi:hypothetical protein